MTRAPSVLLVTLKDECLFYVESTFFSLSDYSWSVSANLTAVLLRTTVGCSTFFNLNDYCFSYSSSDLGYSLLYKSVSFKGFGGSDFKGSNASLLV